MKIPKEAVDFLEHSLNNPFPAKRSLEEALFREKMS